MNTKEWLKSIKKQIAELPKKKMDGKELDFVQRYLGSQKKYLGANTGDVLKIAKQVANEQDAFRTDDLVALLDQLFGADDFEEYVVGGKIFTVLKPEIRAKISFDQLEAWLAKARGWVEVDVICQSSFTGFEVLQRWPDWEKMINKFSKSDVISLRRASLVLQTKPAKEIDDKRLRALAFQTIERLKPEKEVLITKAVSWLLRSLTVQDKEEVRVYILKNEPTLPRIAVRETMKKIETGKKNKSKLVK